MLQINKLISNYELFIADDVVFCAMSKNFQPRSTLSVILVDVTDN
jgi:hypothetical protein